MSAKRDLERELAEIAAGKRNYTSSASQVTTDEYLAERKRDEQANNLLQSSREQAEALKKSTEIAARSAEQAMLNGERLLAEQQRQTEIEEARLDLERERRTADEDHRETMEELAQQRLNIDLEKQEEEREERTRRTAAEEDRLEAQREFQEEQRQRAEDLSEEERLVRSPTYSASLKLLELRELELAAADNKAMEQFFSKYEKAYKDFCDVVLPIDDNAQALIFKKEKQDAEVAELKAAQGAGDQAAETIKSSGADISIYKNALSDRRLDLAEASRGLFSWLPSRKAARLTIEMSIEDIEMSLAEAQAAHETALASHKHLKETASDAAEKVAQHSDISLSSRASLIKEAVGERLAFDLLQTQQNFELWASTGPHSKEYTNGFFPPDAFDEDDEIEIDFDLCIALDQARSQGAKQIEYPDLGLVPFGDDLKNVAIKIRKLRKSKVELCYVPDDSITGYCEYKVLKLALKYGRFPQPPFRIAREDTQEDSLFERAIEIIRSEKSASISLIQRRLKIGYSRACGLLDLLERAAMVGPVDGTGKRSLLPQIFAAV